MNLLRLCLQYCGLVASMLRHKAALLLPKPLASELFQHGSSLPFEITWQALGLLFQVSSIHFIVKLLFTATSCM